MVEYPMQLDTVFHSLSDPIRRDILHRISDGEMSVGELAEQYNITFAAVSKHVMVLEAAGLVKKRKEGRRIRVSLEAQVLQQVDAYLERYRRMWEGRYKKLDSLLNNT